MRRINNDFIHRPHLTFMCFDEEEGEGTLIFQKNANRVFIPVTMVIKPKGGFIVDHEYLVKEMKIEAKSTSGMVYGREVWYHVSGQTWTTLDSNLLLGHLIDKSFYVTKIRMVKYDRS